MTGRGRGKLLLFGEHAAVYGHPALGVSLDLGCSIGWVASESGAPSLSINGTPGRASELRSLLDLVARARAFCPSAGIPSDGSGKWTVESEVPEFGGLGSSAALCAAFARLWTGAGGDDTVHANLWELATHLEGAFHGRSSGIDTALGLGSGGLFFEPFAGSTPPFRLHQFRMPDLPIVFGAFPRRQNTAELVATVASRRTEEPVLRGLSELGLLADSAYRHLVSAASTDLLPAFAEKVRRAQEILASFGLSVPELNRLLVLAEDCGFLAGKISGAGGGGAFYLVGRSNAEIGQDLLRLQNRLTAEKITPTLPLQALKIRNSAA